MPSLPLFGGPHDGGRISVPGTPAKIKVPFRPIDEDDPPRIATVPLDHLRVRHHIYHLSPCGRKYVHTSLMVRN